MFSELRIWPFHMKSWLTWNNQMCLKIGMLWKCWLKSPYFVWYMVFYAQQMMFPPIFIVWGWMTEYHKCALSEHELACRKSPGTLNSHVSDSILATNLRSSIDKNIKQFPSSPLSWRNGPQFVITMVQLSQDNTWIHSLYSVGSVRSLVNKFFQENTNENKELIHALV